jgi:hypothetical protein
MSSIVIKRYIIIFLCAVLANAALGVPRMPRGAFLRHPAVSADLLNTQTRTDSLVMARYARTFGLSPQMLRPAFARMHLMRLPQDRIMQVYFVRPGERIGCRLRRVRRGTLVYALPDSTPLLAQVCGNPLRAGLPPAPWLTRKCATPRVPDFDADEPLPPTSSSIVLDGLTALSFDALSPDSPFAPPGLERDVSAPESGLSYGPEGLAVLAATRTDFPGTRYGSANALPGQEEPADVLPSGSLPVTPPGIPLSHQPAAAIDHITNWTNNDGIVLPPVPSPIFPARPTAPKFPVNPGGTAGTPLASAPNNPPPPALPNSVPEPGIGSLCLAVCTSSLLLARLRKRT